MRCTVLHPTSRTHANTYFTREKASTPTPTDIAAKRKSTTPTCSEEAYSPAAASVLSIRNPPEHGTWPITTRSPHGDHTRQASRTGTRRWRTCMYRGSGKPGHAGRPPWSHDVAAVDAGGLAEGVVSYPLSNREAAFGAAVTVAVPV